MKRILFILNHRSGSHFMEAMLRADVRNIFQPNSFDFWTNLPGPIWLQTVPPEQCQYYGVNNPHEIWSLLQSPPQDPSLEYEAYSIHAPTTGDGSWLKNNLGPGDWTFFFMYRDPRNKIESLLKRAEGRPNHLSRAEIFPDWVRLSKIIASGVIDMKKDPRFHFVDFDIMFDDPKKGLYNMFNTVGLTLDTSLYDPLIDEWNAKHNSSYNDLGTGRRDRWLAWTQEERKYFCEHMGDELIALGYEKDKSWVNR